jgi:hypothetical protein
MGGRVVEGTGLEKRALSSFWHFLITSDHRQSLGFQATATIIAESLALSRLQFRLQVFAVGHSGLSSNRIGL